MREVLSLFLILFLFSCGDNGNVTQSLDTRRAAGNRRISAQSIIAEMERAKYREDELIVKFKPGTGAASAQSIHQAMGASRVKKMTLMPGVEVVRFLEGTSLKDAITAYMSSPGVEYAEPNYIRRAMLTIPNDTLFGQQWALRNTGQFANGTSGADMKAAEAWDITKGDRGVVIAVLDTGMDYNHRDLAANVWSNPRETNCTDGIDNDGNGYVDDCRGWDFFNNDNDPFDDNGHGTHVSGTIGAAGNNATGVSGVMWNVRVIPLKVLDDSGFGDIETEISAIIYAVTNGARIINASFSGGTFSNAEFDAISFANSAGVLFVTVAGNGTENDGVGKDNDLLPEYPGNYRLPNVISAATTDQTDRRTAFSNYGRESVHVAAPGVFILSTVPTGYDFFGGTSMSAPLVSGLAGLLYSQYSTYTCSQIRGAVLKYADSLPSLSGFILTGRRINAQRAVTSLLPPSEFAAALPSPGRISLRWSDNATGEDGYSIERRSDPGTFSEIARMGANPRGFTDDSFTDGATVVYRIRAFADLPNPPGSGTVHADSLTAETSIIAPFGAPTGLSASALSGTQARLSWSDNSRVETGYKIERRAGSEGFVQIAIVSADTTTYTDSPLTAGTAYTYRVKGFSAALGDSTYSNEASVVPSTGTSPGGGDTGGGEDGGSGGCAMTAVKHDAQGDLALLLMPIVLLVLLMRRKGKGRLSSSAGQSLIVSL